MRKLASNQQHVGLLAKMVALVHCFLFISLRFLDNIFSLFQDCPYADDEVIESWGEKNIHGKGRNNCRLNP